MTAIIKIISIWLHAHWGVTMGVSYLPAWGAWLNALPQEWVKDMLTAGADVTMGVDVSHPDTPWLMVRKGDIL